MEAQKSINEIKEELRAAEETMLPTFISRYGEDERAGVKKLVQQAKKQLEQLKREKRRIEGLKVCRGRVYLRD